MRNKIIMLPDTSEHRCHFIANVNWKLDTTIISQALYLRSLDYPSYRAFAFHIGHFQ
jgi:hypothetical protein